MYNSHCAAVKRHEIAVLDKEKVAMSTRIILIIAALAVFVGLGFAMNLSIKKHEAKPKPKKKKGHARYLPQIKNPGK